MAALLKYVPPLGVAPFPYLSSWCSSTNTQTQCELEADLLFTDRTDEPRVDLDLSENASHPLSTEDLIGASVRLVDHELKREEGGVKDLQKAEPLERNFVEKSVLDIGPPDSRPLSLALPAQLELQGFIRTGCLTTDWSMRVIISHHHKTFQIDKREYDWRESSAV